MNAWPALNTELYDGWILRESNGYTKRANSINPIYSSTYNIDDKINYCKKYYSQCNLPDIYKVTSNPENVTLDSKLDSMGYKKIDKTSVQTVCLSDFKNKISRDIIISNRVTDRWINGYIAISGLDSTKNRDTIASMLNLIGEKVIFSIFRDGVKDIAFGYGVVERGWVGYFDIVVAPEYRGRGIGRSIMTSITTEALKFGAKKAYLQVVKGNIAAEKLYNSLGFRELYSYWYRVVN